MSKSESIAKLAEALSKAQAAFPEIKKNRKANMGTYSYKYADMADILAAVTKPLAENGLALTQSPTVIGEKLMLETMLIHSSGEWLSGIYPLASFDNPQAMGSEITYARRYTVTAMLGIQADEDDDGALSKDTPRKAKVDQVDDVDPSEYKITFGKFKGRQLKEITIHELADYVAYIENKAVEDKKPIVGQVAAFIKSATKFIETRIPIDTPLDSHPPDEMPF